MDGFTPSRLILARMRRGLRQQELAELCEFSARTVRAWEKGEWAPDEKSALKLSHVLRFPLSFFYAASIELIDTARASFRSMSTMTAPQRDAVHAAGTLALPLDAWLTSRFKLPKFNVPDLGGVNPETAAETVRQMWELGEGIAPNMVHLLELHGVRVFSLVEDSREVDAFSFWHCDQGFVMLNTMKSVEHSRFDAAHELGHLVLHRHGDIHAPEVEPQAHQFAAALLMPRGGILAQRPSGVSLETALTMKSQWQVSVSAMVRRLRQLDVLSIHHYRELMIDLQRRGWRTSEPYPIAKREMSQVLAKAFGPLRRKGEDVKDVAALLHLPTDELQRMIFRLALADPAPAAKLGAIGGAQKAKTNVTASNDRDRRGRLELVRNTIAELKDHTRKPK